MAKRKPWQTVLKEAKDDDQGLVLRVDSRRPSRRNGATKQTFSYYYMANQAPPAPADDVDGRHKRRRASTNRPDMLMVQDCGQRFYFRRLVVKEHVAIYQPMQASKNWRQVVTSDGDVYDVLKVKGDKFDLLPASTRNPVEDTEDLMRGMPMDFDADGTVTGSEADETVIGATGPVGASTPARPAPSRIARNGPSPTRDGPSAATLRSESGGPGPSATISISTPSSPTSIPARLSRVVTMTPSLVDADQESSRSTSLNQTPTGGAGRLAAAVRRPVSGNYDHLTSRYHQISPSVIDDDDQSTATSTPLSRRRFDQTRDDDVTDGLTFETDESYESQNTVVQGSTSLSLALTESPVGALRLPESSPVPGDQRSKGSPTLENRPGLVVPQPVVQARPGPEALATSVVPLPVVSEPVVHDPTRIQLEDKLSILARLDHWLSATKDQMMTGRPAVTPAATNNLTSPIAEIITPRLTSNVNELMADSADEMNEVWIREHIDYRSQLVIEIRQLIATLPTPPGDQEYPEYRRPPIQFPSFRCNYEFFVRRGDELVANPKPWLAQDSVQDLAQDSAQNLVQSAAQDSAQNSTQDLVQNAAQESVNKSVQVGGRKRRLEGERCPNCSRKRRKVTIDTDGVVKIKYYE